MVPQISVIPQRQISRAPHAPEETPHVDFPCVDAHFLLFAHISCVVGVGVTGARNIIAHAAKVAEHREGLAKVSAPDEDGTKRN